MITSHVMLMWSGGGGAVLLLMAAAIVLLRGNSARQIEQRIDSFVHGNEVAHRPGGATLGGALDVIGHIGEQARRGTRLYSPQDLEALSSILQASGFNARTALPVLLGSKVLLLFLMPLAAFGYAWFTKATPMHRLLMTGGALPIGLLGPEWVLGYLRGRFTKQIRIGVSDALDLLVVCSEAGMGLESAVEQVAREMAHSNAPMALALSGFLDELRVLPDRREAFMNFGNRLGIPELRRTATMLAQSQRYGAPLAQALRSVAAELRRDKMLRIEEKAMRLPGMLVFPLICFIMPSLFIVLVGPSALTMMSVFKDLHK